MSKKASPALFELIKSMSKSEKRYFKILSSRHTIGEENNYITLFDFIEQLTEYDEEAVFRQFKGEAFLNQFSITKNRLYESIMKALDAFHANSSIDSQLARLLHGAEILFKKGLYEHAKRQLISAERLAKKHEKNNVLVEINFKLSKLIETANYSKTNTDDITRIQNENSKQLEILEYQNKLWSIKSKLFMLLNKKGKARSKSDIEEYRQFITQLEQLHRPSSGNFETAYLYNHIYSAYNYATLDDSKSLIYSLNNAALFAENPDKVKQQPNTYFSTLTNIIHLYSQQGKYKEAHHQLNELKSFPKTYTIELTPDLEIKFFASNYSIELMLYVQQAEYSRALELEPSIKQGIEIYGSSISPVRKAYLYFQLAMASFAKEEYKKSLKWTNTILNDTSIDEKEEITAFTHILNLITHLELKNNELLPYAIKNTTRFLKKRNRTFKFETIFLNYLKKATKLDDYFEKIELLEAIQSEVEAISKDPFESVAFEYFDFNSWLCAKLKNTSFMEVKRQQYITSISAA